MTALPPRARRGRLVRAAVAGLVLALAVLAALAWRAWTTGPPTAPDQAAVVLEVPPGASLRQVAGDLHRRGLLVRPQLLLLVARATGCDRGLRVGRYQVPPGAAPRELLALLCRGRPLPVVVTLPEGLDAEALAAILGDSLAVAPAEILAAADALVRGGADTLMHAEERARVAELAALPAPAAAGEGRAVRWCEGYLAPDTYHFGALTDAATAARAVVAMQLDRLREARAAALPPAAGLSAHGLLTLASLVEAEARRADERARVAAVYHNRLRLGMRLEADPTVAFWLAKRGERLLYRDLAVDSPYNTYRRAGLPVGPVGAPGPGALLAAARPDTASRDLFFVADGEGGHIFSQTHAEHERAVARYRELMRERRRRRRRGGDRAADRGSAP